MWFCHLHENNLNKKKKRENIFSVLCINTKHKYTHKKTKKVIGKIYVTERTRFSFTLEFKTNKKNAHTSKYFLLFNVLKAKYSNTSTISYYEQKVKKKNDWKYINKIQWHFVKYHLLILTVAIFWISSHINRGSPIILIKCYFESLLHDDALNQVWLYVLKKNP